MKFSSGFREGGFSLVDMMVVVALIGVISAVSIPTMLNSIEAIRLGQSAREVERELQTAKQRAVGRGRPMRVRFNCPAAGEYRAVELLGVPSAPLAADTATTRCSATTYPYPAPDNNPMTRPNFDGPLRRLDTSVSFTNVQTLEFWPDGTVHYNPAGANPWPMLPAAGVTLTMTRNSKTSTITVNGFGRIRLQ